ncbi:transcriptional regulator MntR [Chromatiales bacterium (ex Bugula neritina AB1)]|nr:transcriptional regulator MntR [Chromatiales bacterium (ex Bugula neritina AB1)]
MSKKAKNAIEGEPLPNAEVQAQRFIRVREAHKYEAIEDYVELIDDLITANGEARLVDVASRMGITQPTASKTLMRLQRDGYITSEPYRSIFLTPSGKKLADTSRARHDAVYQFLIAIGISKECAKRDSEGIEHHVSEETLAVFKRITEESGAA